MTVKGVITDWGGVLTSPLNDAIARWLESDAIDAERYKATMRAWVSQAYEGVGPGGRSHGGEVRANPIHGLEDGTLDPVEFERLLAAELRTVAGGPVDGAGLLRRMFEAFHPAESMYEALRAARKAGARTALLSNSWGNDYPRELWGELFDAVVISAEVGMRKPDERIFRHAATLLGLAPQECVFIDDIDHNIRAAESVGMVGLHHTDPDTTIARLQVLLADGAGLAG